ncbi:DUF3156 family protein [Salmonella enterica]|nr:DUF3156 family protein [Salmonella enterica]
MTGFGALRQFLSQILSPPVAYVPGSLLLHIDGNLRPLRNISASADVLCYMLHTGVQIHITEKALPLHDALFIQSRFTITGTADPECAPGELKITKRRITGSKNDALKWKSTTPCAIPALSDTLKKHPDILSLLCRLHFHTLTLDVARGRWEMIIEPVEASMTISGGSGRQYHSFNPTQRYTLLALADAVHEQLTHVRSSHINE